jgi:EF-P beta-lysylation protein EpmB
MEKGNPDDPLLLQVLSQKLELDDQYGFQIDPVGDGPSAALPGLLHKYHGRVLLITTGACPVHCRYCFRRHYPYSDNQPDDKYWSDAMAYIANDNTIKEVILSGGDPLSLGTKRLRILSQQLAEIPHVTRLRIHTRMPVVLPERINQGFLDWLGNLPWKTLLVIHCNHAQELDSKVVSALTNLGATGTTLLNQSVLLKGINDSASTLINLSEALFSAGVLPYYLHLLDRVIGAAHFEVDEPQALKLMEEVQSRLPGFLVPRLVREVAGMAHKTPVQETIG